MIIYEKKWQEGDLFFDFSKADSVIKLDGPDHGLSHLRIKSVDFVVEWPDGYWLIEVKDPENSQIPEEKKISEKCAFLKKLQSKYLFEDLHVKFMDSLFYLSLDQGIPKKPLYYFILIGISHLKPSMLKVLTQEMLAHHECLKGPKRGWSKGFSIAIFNLAAWRKHLPRCPVTRSGLNHSVLDQNRI
ncbi:MAG: hypothetical protein H7833_00740 [Magnetococcus sp. DMHC-1]